MKRTLFLSILVTALTSITLAAPRSSADALGVAGDFLASRGFEKSAIHPVVSLTRTSDADAPYHLFNIGDGDGFIIVGGDDRIAPILGYSLEGNISPETMPDGCLAWLEAQTAAVASLSEDHHHMAPAYPSLTIDPLLTSKWDQNDPYNRLCPIDKATGKRSATGCVATAMAQVMQYYRYPVQPSGKVEYEDRIQGETRSFDFSAMQPLDWANITDIYTPQSSEKECAAVATLMNAVSHGVKMQFSSDASMAYHYSAGHALVDYFGYSPDIHYYERALLSDEQWISIIVSELEAGRPVLYEGVNPSMGHAFVCDGYDGQGFFHINWGWSGLSDGYFTLSSLTPPNQSTGGSDSGYNLRQTIICNIAPKETPGLLPQEIGLLNIDKLYFRDSAEFHNAADNVSVSSLMADAQLFFYSFNKGLSPFTGEVCAAVIEASGINPVSTVTVDALGSQNYTSIRFPLASISLSNGTYRIGFYYRTSPAGEWHPVMSSTPGTPSQCYVTVSGEQAVMSAVIPDTMPEMVESINSSRLYSNSTATIGFDLINTGSIRLEGHAGVAVMDTSGEYVAFYSSPILCPAEDKIAVEIEASLNGLSVGQYLLMPFYSYSATPSAADIRPLAYHPFPATIEGIVMTAAEGAYFIVEEGKTQLNLNVTNLLPIDWSAPIAVDIVTSAGTIVGRIPAVMLTLGPSETASFSVDCSMLNIPKGSYMARFMIADEKPLRLVDVPMIVANDISSVSSVETEGIEISTAEGIRVVSQESLISVILYDSTGRIIARLNRPGHNAVISSSELPKGIYIIHVATESGKNATRKLRL